jgi:hypothetical protein
LSTPIGNGTLPLTGTAALVIGGTAVPAPRLAAIAAAVIIVGFLLLRFTRPQKLGVATPGRPGKARPRVWRRGSI